MIKDQSWIATCEGLKAAYDNAGLPKEDTLEAIRQLDTFVKRRMITRYGGDGRSEDWSSFAPDLLLSSRKPIGDCDDFALTAASLAICAGVPADRIEFVTVDSRGGAPSLSRVDHAYAAYRDPSGKRWIFGDLLGPVRPVTSNMTEIMWVSFAELRSPDPVWMGKFFGWEEFSRAAPS